MPQFTLHRNHILRTTLGHTLKFEKGVPLEVPAMCVPDAIGIGAVPVEGIESVDPEEVETVPLTPAERKAEVFRAFDVMAARGERIDYTASGVPNAKRIPGIVGFEITTKERDTYWNEYQAEARDTATQLNLDLKMSNG
jgi:hypothetical protein